MPDPTTGAYARDPKLDLNGRIRSPEEALGMLVDILIAQDRYKGLEHAIDLYNRSICRRPGAQCTLKRSISPRQVGQHSPASAPNAAQDFTAVIAPGLWSTLHSYVSSHNAAFNARVFAALINATRAILASPAGCQVCAGHFEEFIEAHPQLLSDTLTQEQAWELTYLAHVTASHHAGKPIVTRSEALGIWG